MNQPAQAAGITELVDALLECTAPITQILDHMARAPDAPDVKVAVELLRELLGETLKPLSLVLAPRDLRAATAVLEASTPLIIENFVLVPHEQPARPGRDPRDAHRPRLSPPTHRTRGWIDRHCTR